MLSQDPNKAKSEGQIDSFSVLPSPNKDEASSDLIDSLDEPTLEQIKDFTLQEFVANQGIDLTEAEKLHRNYPSIVTELFPSMIQDESFIRLKAIELYNTMDKKAKSYLKNWTAVNDYVQIWKQTQRELKNIGIQTPFKAMTYSIFLQHRKDESLSMQLIQDQPTATEARIQGAKKIGFLDSLEYKKALKSIPLQTLEIIENKPEIMLSIKQDLILSEFRDQINNQRNVPDYVISKWEKDAEEIILKMRGIV